MMMFRARYAGRTFKPDPIILRWLLRIIVLMGGHRQFIQNGEFSDNDVAMALGLERWLNIAAEDFDEKALRAELRTLHEEAESRSAATPLAAGLRQNLDRIATLVGLDRTESLILAFAILIHCESSLSDAADWLGQLSTNKVHHALSLILDLNEANVRTALGSQGTLAQSALVTISRNGCDGLANKLDLLSNAFADRMLTQEADPINLLRGTVNAANPAQLTLADFNHVQSLSVLRPYLRHAVANGKRGVNIYLYGIPGTGKTQLARAIAASLQCELFEVASEDPDGDPITGARRLSAFRAAQSFFTRRRALMVFDEAEDVFNDGNTLFGRRSTAQLHKGWLNRILEENPVPTFWLSNSIDGLDPAFVRRFDVVFELPVPPRGQRERILHEACGGLLSAKEVTKMADIEYLAPAVVARASAVVHAVSSDLGTQTPTAAFEQLISNTLEAQGHRPTALCDANRLPDTYNPRLAQADADLSQLAEGLTTARAGRLCLYGPPGTGKTAYGRWLTQRIDRPLLVRRASDLMSMYVGESEKNIARTFQDAVREGAVLMIDEVDSFLQDRREAQRHWESSLVNEMLVQIENFTGVFIASTNLMKGLDQAALRRFDIKVRFGYLDITQIVELLSQYCAHLGLPPPSPAVAARASHLACLTPGDFATVARRSRFQPIFDDRELVAALEAECALKEDGRAPIGFR